jgi:hypothetical protein
LAAALAEIEAALAELSPAAERLTRQSA